MYNVTVEYGSDRNKLTVRTNDWIEEYFDYGEPEDNSFFRDYSWVQPALEAAYQEGLKDGQNV